MFSARRVQRPAVPGRAESPKKPPHIPETRTVRQPATSHPPGGHWQLDLYGTNMMYPPSHLILDYIKFIPYQRNVFGQNQLSQGSTF